MPFFVCVFVLGCTGLHAANASCRFLSSEVPQPCQAVTAPLSRQQEGAEWMCTSIIFFHSIRLLNLEQLGCVSSLWKTVPECLCLVTVEPPPPPPPPKLFPAVYTHSVALYSILAKVRQTNSILFFINLFIQFTKPV